MSYLKPRIIPWLEQQITSQKYPGLKWTNPERTLFQIPWKHGLRQDRSEDDVKIFEAWAIASGSYDPEKDVANPAVWKRNFRSALNRKSEIRVVQDKSSDSNNPHKIYEFNRGNISTGDITPEDLYCGDSISPSSQLPPFNSPRSQPTVDRNLSQDINQMRISNNEDDLYLAPEDLPSSVPASAQDWYNNISSPDVFLAGASPVCPDIPPYVPYQDNTGQVQSTSQEQVVAVQQDLLNQFFRNNIFETEFEVKIYYRGILVKKSLVRNPCGFHLTSRQQTNPESYLEEVTLPSPSLISDFKVAAEINKLLENLEQGTLVEVHNGAICAKRQGKCRSFWSMTETPTTDQPNPISKESYSELYKFQQFVKELIEFIEQKRTESPQYDIWICLGEMWPDSKPWKKKFIMVQVTPISMQMLHELSYSTGASSLRSSEVNLQISDSLSSSLRSTNDLLNLLKEFEERMDCV
ncbi:PREDICTED: interferon regulatory factor 3-like [Nanorana parkeri]|uniref:interferon regulatory factor 3-like n=1 Tax=Nanorana parkeri TaxID=125878 RepID=UPI000854F806|nr:PREDICTED: interferon regulatory factor 3-like [Nanorana parkeri]WPS91084.1 interferon regulatory factor 3 [Nanorana parkeri]